MREPNKVWGKMHALTLGKCSDLLILLMVPVKPNYVIFKSSIIGEPFFYFLVLIENLFIYTSQVTLARNIGQLEKNRFREKKGK